MAKARVVITIEGGIVSSVDSNVEIEALVLDIDKNCDEQYSFSYWNTINPKDFPLVSNNLRESLQKHFKEDADYIITCGINCEDEINALEEFFSAE